jgi:hypothetical protein
MGAWGYEPTDSDSALDWLANAVEGPIAQAIKTALDRFQEDPTDDDKMCEAEAAVAVLLEFTSESPNSKYIRLHLGYIARREGLWSKAIAALKTLQANKMWLSEWNEPDKKWEALSRLLVDLEASRDRTA